MPDGNDERLEKFKHWALPLLEKLKRRALELAHETREATLDVLDEFKRSTIYFKARIGVGLGFIALIGLTLLIAPAPSIANPINAKVVVTAIPWGENLKTIIEVTNDSGDEYKPFVVLVEGSETDIKTGRQRPGKWKYSKNRLREGDTAQIEAKHLTNEQNEGPEIGFTPTVIEVRSADGVFRTTVTVRTLR